MSRRSSSEWRGIESSPSLEVSDAASDFDVIQMARSESGSNRSPSRGSRPGSPIEEAPPSQGGYGQPVEELFPDLTTQTPYDQWWLRGSASPDGGEVAAGDQSVQDPGSDHQSSEQEASPEPEEPARGRKRSREEPNRVRLRSHKGGAIYNQRSGERDKDFAERVNDERREKYEEDGEIEEEEELTKKKVEHARNRGSHPPGFEYLGKNARELTEKQSADLRSLEGGARYNQKSWQGDKAFADEANELREEKYKKSGGIKKEHRLTRAKVMAAKAEGKHPKGFRNIAKNAKKGKTKKNDLVNIMSDGEGEEEGTKYYQSEVEAYGSFADRVNDMRIRKYGKIKKEEKLTEKRLRDAKKKGRKLIGFTVIDENVDENVDEDDDDDEEE